MAAIRNTTRLISGTVRYCLTESSASSVARNVSRSGARAISSFPARCAAASDASHLEKKMPRRRLGPVYKFLLQEEGESFANKENIPKIALKHVSVSFTGQGESTSKVQTTAEANTKPHKKGGKQNQNASAANKARIRSINTAGTKVIMRLDVQNADWLSERVRERIMLMSPIARLPIIVVARRLTLSLCRAPCLVGRLGFLRASKLIVAAHYSHLEVIYSSPLLKLKRDGIREKDRINRDGKLELTSSKTRKQENNYEEVVTKMNKLLEKFQAIINAASYAPLPTPKKVVEKIANFRAERADC
nr:peptidyl-tRNA hydrolase ICT1, mitochondrial-like isoform X2 [Ipomoea batatas]GMD98754.1 peptidyl-tRNA hydrolase ICT1, mitochondrial-like isoform X2 [Ipomoea batatas]